MTVIALDNLPEILTRDLSEKIIRNELKPGERILEAKVAEEMGVSRSPVRESLRMLEKNRLVELIPRKGARVTDITAQHIEWFYDIFEALYSLVARKAAEHAEADDIRRMNAALSRIEQAAGKGDVQEYYDGIFEFAEVGMQAARNPLLEQTLKELWPSNRRIQYASLLFRKDELRKNVIFFQQMARHIGQGEGARVETEVRAYARNEKAFALKIADRKETAERRKLKKKQRERGG
ncbi:MAG: GntR family transcriptional regulator, partial [Thermodesulfobacteriota bacterium]